MEDRRSTIWRNDGVDPPLKKTIGLCGQNRRSTIWRNDGVDPLSRKKIGLCGQNIRVNLQHLQRQIHKERHAYRGLAYKYKFC